MNRHDDRRSVTARHRGFHGGVAGQAMKKNAQPAPAWNERNLPQGPPGSKILLSNLPNDVGEEEVMVSVHILACVLLRIRGYCMGLGFCAHAGLCTFRSRF